MKRYRRVLVAGLGAFVISLAWRTPATLAYHWLGGAKDLPVQLYDIRGKALRGEAKAVLFGQLAAERVTWRWRPVELIKGRFSLDTRVSNPSMNLRARMGLAPGGRFYLDHLDGHVPLPLAMDLFAGGAGTMEGSIEPDELNLRWRDGVLSQVNGDVSLLRLGMPQPGARAIPFGDALLSFSGDSSPWRAEIRDEGGPVVLSGQLTLAADGAYTLDLLAGAGEQNSEQSKILAVLGPPDGEGRHRLSLSGSL